MRSHANRIAWQEPSQALLAGSVDDTIRVAVLAAHPDDETIGASVVLSRSMSSAVIYLTDGAPRDPGLWSPEFRGSREEYAQLREAEARQAQKLVGVSPAYWLGAVDQEAIFSVVELAQRLRILLGDLRVDVLITHPYEGGHPDHDTAALVAYLAIAEHGVEPPPLLVEMTSYHARNSQLITGEFLGGGTPDAISVELSEGERARKREMFAAYSSQENVLSAFDCNREQFRPAPVYDFSRPPHEGTLWYERMGWPMRGERWRALARQRVMGIQECTCH